MQIFFPLAKSPIQFVLGLIKGFVSLALVWQMVTTAHTLLTAPLLRIPELLHYRPTLGGRGQLPYPFSSDSRHDLAYHCRTSCRKLADVMRLSQGSHVFVQLCIDFMT
jgi:hypothetical protein